MNKFSYKNEENIIWYFIKDIILKGGISTIGSFIKANKKLMP
jgi:hypothetical protein